MDKYGRNSVNVSALGDSADRPFSICLFAEDIPPRNSLCFVTCREGRASGLVDWLGRRAAGLTSLQEAGANSSVGSS